MCDHIVYVSETPVSMYHHIVSVLCFRILAAASGECLQLGVTHLAILVALNDNYAYPIVVANSPFWVRTKEDFTHTIETYAYI